MLGVSILQHNHLQQNETYLSWDTREGWGKGLAYMGVGMPAHTCSSKEKHPTRAPSGLPLRWHAWVSPWSPQCPVRVLLEEKRWMCSQNISQPRLGFLFWGAGGSLNIWSGIFSGVGARQIQDSNFSTSRVKSMLWDCEKLQPI